MNREDLWIHLSVVHGAFVFTSDSNKVLEKIHRNCHTRDLPNHNHNHNEENS